MDRKTNIALDSLFSEAGARAVNIKFFPGWGKASPSDLVAEVVKADAQIRSGTSRKVTLVDSELLS